MKFTLPTSVRLDLLLTLLLAFCWCWTTPAARALPLPQGNDQETPEDGGDPQDDPEAADADNHDEGENDGGDENEDDGDGGKDDEGDPIDVSSGAFVFAKTALHIPGRGLNFDLTFRYNNQAWTYTSNTATRWVHTFEDRLVLKVKKGPPITPYPGPGDIVGAGYGPDPDPVEEEEEPVGGNGGFGGEATLLRPLILTLFHYKDLQIHPYGQETGNLTNWIPPTGVFTKVHSILPPGYVVGQKIPTSFHMRHPDGTIIDYDLREWSGCLQTSEVAYYTYRPSRIKDRVGNELQFGYEVLQKGWGCPPFFQAFYRRLTTVWDTYGRAITFNYDANGWLDYVEDFLGRRVTLTHDSIGNLLSITTPEVNTIPADADSGLIPYSSTTEFEYSIKDPTYPDSGHNVVKVFAPNEVASAAGQPYLENTYDSVFPEGFRVVRQVVGSDSSHASGIPSLGTFDFIYDHQPSFPQQQYIDHGWFQEISRTAVIKPNGDVALYIYDEAYRARLVYKFTGRFTHPADHSLWGDLDTLMQVDPATWPPAPGANILLNASPALGSHDPDPGAYVIRMDYNDDSLLTNKEGPDWQRTHVYDTQSPDRHQRANMLVERRMSSTSAEEIILAYSYEPLFNQVRTVYDPRGLSSYTPPHGVADPDRYSVTQLLDYEEGPQSAVQGVINTWDIDLAQASMQTELATVGITAPPMSFNLGDLNNFFDYPAGNIVKTQTTIHDFVDPLAANPSFAPTTIEHTYQYNLYFVPVGKIDPDGVETRYEYYPETDPSGTGGGTPSETDGGHLARIIYAAGDPEQVSEEFGYNDAGQQDRYVDGRGFETTALVNERDQAVTVSNALGHSMHYLYDLNDNVTEVWLDHKRPTYDANYRPNGEEDLGVIKTTMTYDILGHLVSRNMEADDSSTIASIQYRFDKNGNRVLTLYPTFSGDPAHVRSSVFDERGRMWSSSLGGVTTEFSSLYANQNIPELAFMPVDPGEFNTSYKYYTGSNLTRTEDAEQKIESMVYDGFNRLQISIDGVGNETEYTWNPADQMEKTVWRDDAGVRVREVLRSIDELGRAYQKDEAWLDPSGALLFSADIGLLTPGDGYATSRRVYDQRSSLLQDIDDNRVVRTQVFDALQRPTEIHDGKGNSSFSTYDANHQEIYQETHHAESEGSPGLLEVYRNWMFHDELGRVTSTVNDLGHTRRFLYDSRGNVVFTSDARSTVTNLPLASLDSVTHPQHADLSGGPAVNDHGNVRISEYDHTGYPIKSIYPRYQGGLGGNSLLDVAITRKEYDLTGRLLREIDDNGHAVTRTYDALHRERSRAFDDLSAKQFDYFNNGLIKDTTDQNGTLVSYQYDAGNRMTRKDITRATGVLGSTFEVFDHDALGRITYAQNDLSVVTRSYNSMSHLSQESIALDGGAAVVTSAEWDGVGNQVTLNYPGGRIIDNVYDSLNRLDSLGDRGAPVPLADFAYYGPNRLKRRSHANGTETSVQYDAIGRVGSVQLTSGASQLDHRSFSWNRVNSKTSRSDSLSGLSTTYGYDSLDRMEQSLRTGGGFANQTIDFALDGVGNRLSISGGAGAGNYTMNIRDFPVNQYTTSPLDSRVYDHNGNLKSRGTGTMIYDHNNQMVEYTDGASGDRHVYDYDALLRRLRKIEDVDGAADETRYYYDAGGRVIEERDGFGTTQATYVFGREIDSVITLRSGGQDYYYHADDLGNVLHLTGRTGGIAESYEYDDYGTLLDPTTLQAPVVASPLGNPYFFTGRRLDSETGLYYFRARYMEPEHGRFTTRDPIGIWGDPTNLGNGYTYVANNPWSATDPLGLWNSKSGDPPNPNEGNVGGTKTHGDTLRGDTDHHGSASSTQTQQERAREKLEKHKSKKLVRKLKWQIKRINEKIQKITDKIKQFLDPDFKGGTIDLEVNDDGSIDLVSKDEDGNIIDRQTYEGSDKGRIDLQIDLDKAEYVADELGKLYNEFLPNWTDMLGFIPFGGGLAGKIGGIASKLFGGIAAKLGGGKFGKWLGAKFGKYVAKALALAGIGSGIARQFILKAGGKSFFIAHSATKHMSQLVLGKAKMSPGAVQDSFKKALSKLAKQGYEYDKKYMVNGWEIIIGKGRGGSLDAVYHAVPKGLVGH